jgi:hypothetical protein
MEEARIYSQMRDSLPRMLTSDPAVQYVSFQTQWAACGDCLLVVHPEDERCRAVPVGLLCCSP